MAGFNSPVLRSRTVRIGLTYDLRSEYLAAGYGEEETAEFDRPDTIAALERALRGLGHNPVRIGTARQLVDRLASGDGWDLVFNIAEGLYGGAARESQVPAILDAYDIPYTFSDPVVTGVCLHKALTKLVVRQAGVPTPGFAVVSEIDEVADIALPFPLFAKPVAEGTGKGIGPTSRVLDRDSLGRVCRDLLDRFHQPVLVETFLPGREFTVGILGTGGDAVVLGALEIVLRPNAEQHAYSYVNKERCEELVEYRAVEGTNQPEVRRAEQVALDAWRALGCRDAGRIDLRSDADGTPNFIECNPLAGLHPLHSDLPLIATAAGMPYQRLIERIVESADKRRPKRSLPRT